MQVVVQDGTLAAETSAWDLLRLLCRVVAESVLARAAALRQQRRLAQYLRTLVDGCQTMGL